LQTPPQTARNRLALRSRNNTERWWRGCSGLGWFWHDERCCEHVKAVSGLQRKGEVILARLCERRGIEKINALGAFLGAENRTGDVDIN
jgi:hypothetical protein